jgi:MFS family permease
MSDGNITLLYSVAMFVDAIAALLIGKAYDRIKKRTGMESGGLLILVVIPFLSVLLPFLTLRNTVMPIIIGMIIFGIVIGTHETIMRSAIADIAPFSKRGTGYGIFNTSYGLALLGGAALMGWLYDLNNIRIIIAFTCITQVVAILLYLKMNRMVRENQ